MRPMLMMMLLITARHQSAATAVLIGIT